MPLFQIAHDDLIRRLSASQFAKERDLQKLIEINLPSMFGVQFIASEFLIRGEQAGRIDTLGLDTDNSPVVIEYKRSENENVINQGLYYVNWLLEHRGDFIVAAQNALGSPVEVSWSNPRLIVIAQSYAKWDTHAVKRMGGNIELWAYTIYDNNLLHLELVYGQQRSLPPVSPPAAREAQEEIDPTYTVEDHLSGKSDHVVEMFEALREGIFGLAFEEGDIIETPNKLYISYRHGRNFCEIEVQAKSVKLTLDIPHAELNDPQGLAHDVSNVGHWGTGDAQAKVNGIEQIEYALGLIEQAYRQTI